MVFIIAELGTNHMGDMDIAKKMMTSAKDLGCDAVKLQKKNVEKIYTQEFLDAYLESPWGTTQREMRLHREFSIQQVAQLFDHAKTVDIPLFFSCWDIDSQKTMRQFDMPYNKVASAMLVHKRLLHEIALEKKYTFISTGMSTMQDIENAVDIFRQHQCPFELMHCHSAYPMVNAEANLKLIPFLREKFKCDVGYSGHEVGTTDVCIPAVMLGATSIERHFTLNRTWYGYDQAASLGIPGMRRLVEFIRAIDVIMGEAEKKVWDSELPSIKKLRQKFV